MAKLEKLEEEERLGSGPKHGVGRGGVPPPKEYQFKPGHSGNPGGRPRSTLTRLMRELLEADDQLRAKQFVRRWYELATHGNGPMFRELLRRVEGLVENDDDEPESQSPTLDDAAGRPRRKRTPENRRETGDGEVLAADDLGF